MSILKFRNLAFQQYALIKAYIFQKEDMCKFSLSSFDFCLPLKPGYLTNSLLYMCRILGKRLDSLQRA